MRDLEFDLETDIKNSRLFIEAVNNHYTTCQIYSGLFTKHWYKLFNPEDPEDVRAFDILRSNFDDKTRIWACSSRYASAMVVDLRNKHHAKCDNELDYYFGPTAQMSNEVIEMFRKIGWVLYPEQDR